MSNKETSEQSNLLVLRTKKKFSIKSDIAMHPTTKQIFGLSGRIADSFHNFTILWRCVFFEIRKDAFILDGTRFHGELQIIAPFNRSQITTME